MVAFEDSSIQVIISNIGVEDSIRLLPYIVFFVIRNHPKIFMGYSDAAIAHLFCYKSGLSSFYGPAVLTDFAENVEMHSYTINFIQRTFFSADPIGRIEPAKEWTSEFLEWTHESNSQIKRKMQTNQVLQGEGTVSGRLLGGGIEVLEFAKGTVLWSAMDDWKNCILFFEISEENPLSL